MGVLVHTALTANWANIGRRDATIENAEMTATRPLHIRPSLLSQAMSLYRQAFGHSVPSYEIKNAALSGSNARLAGLILAYVGCGEANPAWAAAKHPYEHEHSQGGLGTPKNHISD